MARTVNASRGDRYATAATALGDDLGIVLRALRAYQAAGVGDRLDVAGAGYIASRLELAMAPAGLCESCRAVPWVHYVRGFAVCQTCTL